MKLRDPFYRLPLRIDADRLAAEVNALPPSAWDRHPTDFEGNSVARLISVGGGENDDVSGSMAPTAHLEQLPYARQLLASFGVVWSRSRLMQLAPGAQVPEHADINYHWFNRVRVHIPVMTRPQVRFYCGDASVHMAAGEAWIFDNWRRHRVENGSDQARIHLVADTTGSAAFWRMVMRSQGAQAELQTIPYQPEHALPLFTERFNAPAVMPPSELDILLGDLTSELEAADRNPAHPALGQFASLVLNLSKEWRQLWLLFAESAEGFAHYAKLRDTIREQATRVAAPLRMRTNQVPAMQVLEARVLQHLLLQPRTAPSRASRAAPRFERPLIIVSAPRSGSTLLFETLACSAQLWTLGGEAHWLIENLPELAPGAPGVESNRLTGEHCTEALASRLRADIAENLQDCRGAPWHSTASVRLLEKTPKNALRIPFFDRLFPDARFVFLWRDPRENLSSIMEAWRAGHWITYPHLPGWDGPWSMLLPPGWPALRGRTLEEIAAFQWLRTNEIILDDLAALPKERSTVVEYAGFIADPRAVVRSLCEFAGIEFDPALATRVAGPLPPARYTQTPPKPGKWQVNREAIERVLPSIQQTWDRLRDYSSGASKQKP